MYVKKGRGHVRGLSGKRYSHGMVIPPKDISEVILKANLADGRIVKGKDAEQLAVLAQNEIKDAEPKEKAKDKDKAK